MSSALLSLEEYHVNVLIKQKMRPVIRGVDFTLKEGEILGIIGESGSGKSIMLKSMLGLLPERSYDIIQGNLWYKGQKWGLENRKALLGSEIAFVFQNPKLSLSPMKRIGYHFKEVFRIHKMPYDAKRVNDLLKDVGLPHPEIILKQYPYQISGGQGQRIALALALVSKPKVIIADEPTSAIDASLKQKMMALLKKINEKYGTAMIIVTHDFDVIAQIAHRLFVMYGGLMLDEGETKHLLERSVHPYTRGLMKCAVSLSGDETPLYQLEGYPMTPENYQNACPFYERCERKIPICNTLVPQIETHDGERFRCCHPYL